jgi:hypothetical protein
METPTPLPTPPVGAKDYQLAAWNEDEGFGLVNIAEQFSFADNLPMPFGDKRFNYQNDQTVILLAAREALQRYPNTKYKEKLEWRIALSNTILDSPDSDEWILKELENALNDKRVTPDNLYQLPNQFGFEIGQLESAPNLFGNGQPAQVLWITRQDSGYTGLYAALSQDKQGHYTLTKIYSSWDFNFGDDEPVKIEDHTGDNIPEVIMFPGYYNGSFCGYELVIYQWKNNHFTDASRGQFSFDQCSFPESWDYGTPDKNGAEPIESWQSVAFDSAVTRHEHYVWNGERYELNENLLVPPDRLDNKAATWVVYAMNAEDYQTIIEKIEQFLSEESQLQAIEPELGPSYPDFLRFQLGLAHAFQSDKLQARAIFEDIIQNPRNPSTITLSKTAQVYLDNYNGDADLYRACQAALQIMEQALGNQSVSSSYESNYNEHLIKTWGYQPSSLTSSSALCNLSVAFNKIVAQLAVSQFENAPEQLRKAGVLIRSAVEADLDGDGQKEWVLLIDTPGDDAPVNLWALLKTSNGILPLPVISWERKQFDLPHEDTGTTGLNVETVISPEGTAITFILAGEHLYLLKLDTVNQTLDQLLFSMDSVESYTFYQRDDRLELEVTTNYDYCQHCKDTYVWLDDDFMWSDLVSPPGQLEAEATLLADSKPKEAILLLQNILNNSSNRGSPRLMYLLGLAYELTGDDINAVQTYWKVWHNYSDSAYARLAQAKLELKK